MDARTCNSDIIQLRAFSEGPACLGAAGHLREVRHRSQGGSRVTRVDVVLTGPQVHSRLHRGVEVEDLWVQDYERVASFLGRETASTVID